MVRVLIPNAGLLDSKWLEVFPECSERFSHRWLSPKRAKISAQAWNPDDLTALGELIEVGKVTPIIDRTYTLAEAVQAVAYVGEGHARGKVVIAV